MNEWNSSDITGLQISNVSDADMDIVRSLIQEWSDRRTKNLRRSLYHDGEQAFRDLGLMLPPQLKNAKFYLGWGTMAVRKAAVRSQFEGLRLPGSEDPLGLNQTLAENNFGLELGQGINSAYTHGPAFVTVAKGGEGEPDVQIQPHSAVSASALWDRRKRRVAAALTISAMDRDKPSEFIAYLPDKILKCAKGASGWTAEVIPNQIKRTLVVPLTYDPQLMKPFGRSRISGPVMALTDMAVRAYVRMEGNAEFYSSPQLAIEGIDPEAFGEVSETKKFKLAMDRLIALTRDAEGNAPTIKQLQQATMTPHSDMLRTVAMAFSGETGIPPHSLGVIHDNPSSAEAIRAAEHDLLIDVTHQNRYVLGTAVTNIARLAVMVRDGLTEPPAESWNLSARFADPEFRSTSANADAYVKMAGSNPELAMSSVLLETVFDDDQVDRIQAERKREQSGSLVSQLLASRTTPEVPVDGGQSSVGAVPLSE
ncbi:phage portal protein [Arthrobacter sp. zg-Y20]|uniref:phage portal protein n=1 Tax=unclassified Arthrobacter TaxID=235627 RepID=UPI001D1582E0|nr:MULTISPECIES: phage portal protein [unclassified Arthrobacter]MCC3277525.1 phage portal protein [Arthrobacter sp. zg-Y20]MDK1317683.1 phage portal protein [Arthrobacter sp. zg.Y20]WIB07058.1 phage portal protein [Arthrobacter sp. zg-Y20]